MRTPLKFLTVRGNNIYNQSGDGVRFPGFCLGSWLNMGAFMVGFPGTETEFRRAVTKVLGKQKGGLLFS